MVLSATMGFLNLASNLIAARSLRPALYADYGAFLAILSVLLIPTTVFTTRAIQLASVPDVSARAMQLLKQSGARFGAFMAMMGVAAMVIVYHHVERSPISWWMLMGVALLLLLAPIEAVFVGILQAHKQFIASQLGRTFSAALKVVGLGLLLWLLGKGFKASVLVVLVSPITSSGYIFYAMRRARALQRSSVGAAPVVRTRWRARGRWSLPFAMTLGSVLFFNVDLLVAKSIFSAYAAGLFAALTMSGKIMALGTGPISAVLYPHLLTTSDTRHRRRLIIGALGGTLAIGLVVLLCFGLGAKPITNAMFGSSYAQIAPLLVYYGMAFLFFSLTNVVFTALLAFNSKVLWTDVIGGTIIEVVGLLTFHHSLHMFTVVLAGSMALLWVASTIQLYPYLRKEVFRV